MTTVREQIDAIIGRAADYEAGLDALTIVPSILVDPVLIEVVREACTTLWRNGWQPVELHRVVLRRADLMHAQLVVDAVAAHLGRFAPTAVDGRWTAQAHELGARVWWTADAAYLDEVVARWRLDRVAVLDVVLTLLTTLAELPAIEVLVPPPGTPRASTGSGAGARTDTRLLDRVRALLAKAESTDFPAEAEAYTAKAQELVARHSIDEALLAERDGGTVVPFARRIGVDHPYEGEKAALLDAVARANHCHAVWSPDFGFVTVFGFDADIDAVDLLHASLLVQANRAMSQTEPAGGKAGRARLKAFRQSFLVAFAVRIGERLAAAADAVLADSTGPGPGQETGGGLLPVLASRAEQVRETMQKVFPHTVRGRGSRVASPEGWTSGRAAADRVALPTS